ncbi:Serine/threonine kinase [Acanthamoeba castellanii str. Neff]|uniref:non-specific serine/threonine protein kinase n=1 Tax=Acanthamoeba castellanii (strain ATCC 30010 / Neff) TaxID=1257118 RepID=L8GSP9_ACACF|nr:Serine/threonine kinase [Acanthamoeba castellanii str. Neff]ELR15977.1 Serine/threonine kinase [Acanthamoeba castellanii str. Neff]
MKPLDWCLLVLLLVLSDPHPYLDGSEQSLLIRSANAQSITGGGEDGLFFGSIITSYSFTRDDFSVLWADTNTTDQAVSYLNDQVFSYITTHGPVDESQVLPGRTVAQLPVVGGAVVLVYNLAGLPSQLVLDGPTVARLWSGNLTGWDDPQIDELNPGNTLTGPVLLAYSPDTEQGSISAVFRQYLASWGATGEINEQGGAGAFIAGQAVMSIINPTTATAWPISYITYITMPQASNLTNCVAINEFILFVSWVILNNQAATQANTLMHSVIPIGYRRTVLDSLSIITCNGEQATTTSYIVGMGSLFNPFPTLGYYYPSSSFKLKYFTGNSATSLANLKQDTIDFGQSSTPLLPRDLEELGDAIAIPGYCFGLTPAYNIPELIAREPLRLDWETIAGIYLGTVTMWNDTAIQNLNPELAPFLPQKAIRIVYQSNNSSITLTFNTAMGQRVPEYAQVIGVTCEGVHVSQLYGCVTEDGLLCSDHGTCTEGVCSCEAGWWGPCATPSTPVPQDSSSSPVLGLALGIALPVVVLIVCLALLVVLIVFLAMRRGKESEGDYYIPIEELELGDLLGAGGFGEVYKAKWKGTEVAAKLLPRNATDSREKREAFVQEMRVMSKLRHPNVVLFMAACKKPPILCIVMEYMALGSVFDLINNDLVPEVPMGLKLKMTFQAAKGMHFLHSSDIVHRDLKSLNLLLDNKWNVKVSDFGLTAIKDSIGKGGDKALVCSVPWTAPEVLQDEVGEDVDYTMADVYSFGIRRRTSILVMELVERGSLHYVLADRSLKLSWPKRLSMLRDAALGINYLHSLGVIHRDLKSHNLLVDENWGVKVGDFGFATAEQDNATMTRCGTPSWTAPEILSPPPGGAKYDESVDVYSFGIVMWEVLTRRAPYHEKNAVCVAVDVIQGQRPPIPPDTDKQFAQLMQRCWDASPRKRPSMDEIMAYLNSALDKIEV